MRNEQPAASLAMSRRTFLGGVLATGAFLPKDFPNQNTGIAAPSPICVFSKHLHWLPVSEIGRVAADLGFDGIDLTVRSGGHVEPERAVTDLPKAVEMIRKAGLDVPMIVTDIINADDPLTEPLLKTAGQMGIKYYRTAYLKYDPKLDVLTNLARFAPQMQRLADLNQKYGIQGAYQNHAGTNVGAAVWDLHLLLKDIDPRWLGCQYDIKHAVAEGGMSWVNGLDMLQARIGCVDIKDFHWAEKGGQWHNEEVPLGEGMVDFKKYFSLLKQYGFSGPMSQHFEYSLGGAEKGKKELTVNRSVVLAAMKKDLNKLRALLAEANAPR
jgi:L-ribulose-5-phosphate 3-epimerase